jgi:hypothetical protein
MTEPSRPPGMPTGRAIPRRAPADCDADVTPVPPVLPPSRSERVRPFEVAEQLSFFAEASDQ